ncbi:MAG: hypothetical protein J6A70_02700 [Prevotella sp.]|nr:hypothetical protein [Prevotella sp.]
MLINKLLSKWCAALLPPWAVMLINGVGSLRPMRQIYIVGVYDVCWMQFNAV